MLSRRNMTGSVVVIGAGTMGGGIAAQLANAGRQVYLLDLAGSDPQDRKSRNQAAIAGLDRLIKNRPPLLALPEYAARIQTGNIEDDLECLRDADWVVEAVAERMEVKQEIMALIEAHIVPETIVSSNTSGLSLSEMTARCSPQFRSRFLGTHFLNPPRYLKLLEVIPLAETRADVTAGFAQFAEQTLGHRVVFARDTPGFISTRIWIQHLLESIRIAARLGLTIEETDLLTGGLIGRPRSGTFRMADLVGLDIIADIARNQYARLPDDPYRESLRLPTVLQRLIESGRLGDKSGGGFYRREGGANLALDLQTLEYLPRREPGIEGVDSLQALPLPERFKALSSGLEQERGVEFLYQILNSLTQYVSKIGLEIADDALSIDRVMKWGFHWEIGPCEISDLLQKPAKTTDRNFEGEGASRRYRVFGKAEMQPIPVEPEYLSLSDLKTGGGLVLESEVGSLIDLGDGVACLEFHTKMNTFSPALSAFVVAARERAEREFVALVIGNQGPHFSAGYNLNLFLEAMNRSDWQAIDRMLEEVQSALMGLKYARVPVVTAPHGYTLGAGCECVLHCHAIQAAQELSMGLPELSVGVIPAGGGTKELLARAMADWDGESDPYSAVERVFNQIVFNRNSSSADEARKAGLLRPDDGISRNADRRLYEAKERALMAANAGFTPQAKQRIRVMGEEALARLRMQIHWQWRAGAISDHDRLIADRVAYILSGGALPYAQEVSEEYLLHLERQVFIELVQEPKTAERMQHVLATGKPVRN